jgi:glycosyltransferase involved in cell wall biosynthesis
VEQCKAKSKTLGTFLKDAADISQEKPRRILFAIHWYELGGAESFALSTIKAAYSQGHECYCIATVPSLNRECARFAPYCVDALDLSAIKPGQSFTGFISDYLAKKSIDIVHIHHSANMYEALPVVRKQFPELLIVDSTHIVEYGNGGFPFLSTEFSEFIDRHNVISINLINVQSSLHKQLHDSDLNHSKFQLTYLSSLFARADQFQEKPSNNPKIITFYGRLARQKQPNIFIAVIELLFQKFPEQNIEAHMYGDGEMRTDMENRIARSVFKDRINFMGRCDDQSVVFNNCDILLLTSLNEGLSLTSYEALAYKCLVVSSDVGAQSELLSADCLIPLTSTFIEDAVEKIGALLTKNDRYQQALNESLHNLEKIRLHEFTPVKLSNLYADRK